MALQGLTIVPRVGDEISFFVTRSEGFEFVPGPSQVLIPNLLAERAGVDSRDIAPGSGHDCTEQDLYGGLTNRNGLADCCDVCYSLS